MNAEGGHTVHRAKSAGEEGGDERFEEGLSGTSGITISYR